MDKRLKEISSQLSEYSLGRFNKKMKISTRLDEVDAVISGINMLGEELRAATISRNYFNNIFDSVSDMVFVLNNKGIIEDTNKQVETQLKFERGILKGKSINCFLKRNIYNFKNIASQLKRNNSPITKEGSLQTSEGCLIPVRMNISYFLEEQKKQLILLTASDITFQIKTENLIIRAIIDTQEKERKRLAKDLHDSLAQQLSAIKFYISTAAELTKNQKQKAILCESNKALMQVLTDMRSICFNLMPKTLEEFGLVNAVREFCNHLIYPKKPKFIIKQRNSLPDFSSELKIDLYRVIQEFITNAIKHGEASKIIVSLGYHENLLKVKLMDNGKGFEREHSAKGMGLRNVQSRVKSHDGTLHIVSNIGKGTFYEILIPLNAPGCLK